MPRSKKHPKLPPDPDAGKTTLELIAEVVPNPEQWLTTPYTLFGPRTPQDILDEGTYEPALRDLVLAYKYGNFS